MVDNLSVIVIIAVGALGVSWLVAEVTRAIVVTLRAWPQRRRNRRWVRAMPARPVSPGAGRAGAPQGQVEVVRAPLWPLAVANSNRRRVTL